MMMMAVKKMGGATKNGRTSNPKYLGIKVNNLATIFPGSIILKQRGKKYHLLSNVYYGKDFSIHSSILGTVTFVKKIVKNKLKTFVGVNPISDKKMIQYIEIK